VSILSSRARSLGLLALGVLLLGAPAGPAAASPETLKRSVSNILMAPLDVAFTPVVAANAVYTNLQNVDDTMPVRIAYVIPGYVWNMGVQIGAATVRAVAGGIEFLPGLGLFFFDADLDPLFSPAEKAPALVDFDTPPLNFKFGITYTE
jgi:hypothetical protein